MSWELLPANDEVEQNIKSSCLGYFPKIQNPSVSSPKYEITGTLFDPWDGMVNQDLSWMYIKNKDGSVGNPNGEGYVLFSGANTRYPQTIKRWSEQTSNTRYTNWAMIFANTFAPFMAYGGEVYDEDIDVDITY